MSLETLLEAAQFLELSGEPNSKARVKPPADFHRYAKSTCQEFESGGSKDDTGSNSDANTDDTFVKDPKKRQGGGGTREVHNRLEKNRRAHLKECFENLKRQVPSLDDKKISNLNILKCALRYIQGQKRKEKEMEQEMQHLASEKIRTQQRIKRLKHDLAELNIEVDVSHFMAMHHDHSSISTATADDDKPILSEEEEESEQMIAANHSASEEDCPPSQESQTNR